MFSPPPGIVAALGTTGHPFLRVTLLPAHTRAKIAFFFHRRVVGTWVRQHGEPMYRQCGTGCGGDKPRHPPHKVLSLDHVYPNACADRGNGVEYFEEEL